MLYETFEKIYALERQGRKIIKLNVGEPDWGVPESSVESAFCSIKNHEDKYASARGQLSLREKVAKLHNCSSENVVISTGSKIAIFSAMKSLLGPKDNAIILSPYWQAYELIARSLGAGTKILPLKQESKWKPNIGALEDAVDKNTKLIILNSPSNPTSVAIDHSEENKMLKFAQEHGITVLADDAYRGLSFQALPDRGLSDNLVIANTFSKTFGMTGWRIGYAVAHESLAKKLVEFNQITTTNVPVFIQQAAQTALEQKGKISKIASAKCEKRANLAKKSLSKELEFVFPDAGFYIFPKLPRGIDSVKFSDKLLEKGVAVVPGPAFGNYPNNFRLSLAAGEETLKIAFEAVNKTLGEM